MSFDYIHAAMEASDLSAAQKAVLLNYCIRADVHGYSWPGRRRMVDDTGLSLRTVNYAKATLIEKGLIGNKARSDSNGRQITDLVRVNLAAMKAIARERKDYKDNLIEEITFDEEKSQVDGGATLAPLDEEGASLASPRVHQMHPGGAPLAPQGCSPCTPEGAALAPKSPQQPPLKPHEEPSSSIAGVAGDTAGRKVDPWEIDDDLASPEPRRGSARSKRAGYREPSVDAWRVVGSLKGVPAAQARALAVAVDAPLSLGWTPDEVVETMKGRITPKANNSMGLYYFSLKEDLSRKPDEKPVQPTLLPSVRSRIDVRPDPQFTSNCRVCQHTSGGIEDENGNRLARCYHDLLANCPDCSGTGRVNGMSCSHPKSTGPVEAAELAKRHKEAEEAAKAA